MENSSLFTGAYAPRLCCVAPTGLIITLHSTLYTLHGGLRTPPMLCRPYGANHGANHNSTLYTGVDTPAYAVSPLTGLIITLHSTLYTGAYAPRLCCVAPTGLITGLIITLHSTRGLTPPPMLYRPYGANHGANHNSTLYTGVDTPAYAVSPLTGLIITLHSTLYTLHFLNSSLFTLHSSLYRFFTLHFLR